MKTAPKFPPQLALELPAYIPDHLLLERGSLTLIKGRVAADARPVLLKILRDQEGPDSSAAVRLRREYAMLRKLADRADVAQAVEYLQITGGAVLIIDDDPEYIPLAECFNRSPPTFARRPQIAVDLTSILAALHDRQILHHNLNPATVLIRGDGVGVRLTGFDFAGVSDNAPPGSEATHEATRPSGDLRFVSPERTGRIHRGVDARSDLYSLGALLYFLFTGRPPFSAADPLKLVHAHIARDPLPPHAIVSEIPEALSAILLKLLAKNSEDRYESAEALAVHLREVRDRSADRPDSRSLQVALDSGATHGQFQISKKLYGRENEISALAKDFQEHSGFAKRFVLVSGPSGIGKSALVASLAEPVHRARGFFAAGKYDPLRRDTPYNAVAQAVRDWIEQLLTESPAELNAWRESLTDALGANGRVMADVIPEIEYLIGPSAPAQPLAPAEQRDRFNLIFRNFARIFTKHARPLLLFLDDLQWADLASLELLELLLADEESSYLFVVGAYREEEVEPADPLFTSLTNIKKSAKDTVRTIPLGPLDFASIAEMIADFFGQASAEIRPVGELAKLIQNYTDGNPFFILESLKALHQERLVWHQSGRWNWDIEKIRSRSVSNDVAKLMADRLRRLPRPTLDLVLNASCIGDTFDLELLARLNQSSQERAREILNAAIEEGLIVERKDRLRNANSGRPATCSFVHDRVQQTAYAMLSEEERRVIHRALGLLLLGASDARQIETLPPETIDAFAVANHLNLGLTDELTPPERVQLARLNLAAGKRARGSTAYRVSLKYFKQAADLLPREAWRDNHDLAIDLHRQWSECEYLSGNFDRAERLFNIALRNARRKEDRADIYTFRIVQYTNQGRYRLALTTLHTALAIFNVNLSPSPSTLTLHWNIFQTERRIAHLDDESLLAREETHPARDPEIEACVRLLLSGMAPAYELAEQRLFCVLSMRALQLSLRHGFTAETSFALACYGITLSRWRGQYGQAMRYGRLAQAMSARRNYTNILCRNQFLLGAFIAPWREALGDHSHLRHGHKLGRESGNVIYGGYCLVFLTWHRFYKGENLATLCAKLAGYETFFRTTRDYSAEATTSIVSRLCLNLQELTDDPTGILDSRFDADYFFEHIWVFGLASFYLSSMIQAYLNEDYAKALAMAEKSQIHMSGTMVTVLQPEHYFYHSLALAATHARADRRERRRIGRRLKRHGALFRAWTENCPANFESRYLLIEAERARLAGDETAAMRYFERTITSARSHGFPQIEALACDLGARFYRDWNFPTLAAAHAHRARRLYADWGATIRLKALDRALPEYSVKMS